MKDYITDTLAPGKRNAQLNLLDDALRRVLSGIFGRHQHSDRVLAAYFKENRRCGSRDRAFISDAVYALLRYWGFLRKYLPEERLEELESGNVRFTSRELGALLMAGAFINGSFDNAEIIRSGHKLSPSLPRPANAPERRARQMADYFNTSAALTVDDLLPEWILNELPANLDRGVFISALALRPPIYLRTQCVSGEAHSAMMEELNGLDGEIVPHPQVSNAIAVRAKTNLYSLESYRNGCFEIQDLASQCVGLICDARPGSRWLDACAGAGGKTLQLAQMMKRKGNVTASDLRAYKLEDLRRRARRAGFPNITVKENIAASGKVKHPFDGVLIDAPCSCSGVWRRNPGAQWILTAEEVAELAAQQLEILNNYANAVRTGGILVYATCSIFDAENGDVVRAFLAKHPEFKLDPFTNPLTGDIAPGMLRIDGGNYDCDTLFAARMIKVEQGRG
ncbi:MAG: RsmB/NOP family class I SAM-dependent RNA methyltransferase [Lentisphaeria bacterium]|nr:RsmB/NOP family class I SAM-dependent RNA methyltransferase [Lentisphaeria bacterium]